MNSLPLRFALLTALNGFEQVASARWLIPFQCPDGCMAADGRMIVETLNLPGSKRKQRTTTATATITFDGPSNFPFPEPFIRIDERAGRDTWQTPGRHGTYQQ